MRTICTRLWQIDTAEKGEVFVTATGNVKAIRKEHLQKMKDGVILANSGHFNVEICIPDLEALTKEVREIRPNVEEYRMRDDRRIYLIAKGRLVNLSAAEGHPPEVMMMSFANQALSVKYLFDAEINATCIVPGYLLPFMDIETTKEFSLEQVPSYKRTEVITENLIKSIGSTEVPYLQIIDDIPQGFEAPTKDLIEITKDDEIIKEFLFPAYKIWNIAAHADDIVNDLEVGLKTASSDGLGGHSPITPLEN